MFKLKNLTPQRMAKIALVAAIYVALTLSLSFMSYGDVQFRIAEMLMLLCFFNKDYCVSLTLGCAISNLFSPFALIDVPIGTAATLIAAILMWKSKNIYVASLFPVLLNALFVGLELTFMYQIPLWWSSLSVAIGEFAVVSVLGIVVFKTMLLRSKFFMRLIGNQKIA